MKNRKQLFIVIEGLDGSGKTACASEVGKLLEATVLTTPNQTLRKFRSQILSSFSGDQQQEAAELFYLSTVFAASAEAASVLNKGNSVILDRYFLSTQAYASFRGSTIASHLDALADQLLPADLTIYLQASLETRKKRLYARGRSEADHETLTPESDKRLYAEHVKRSKLLCVGRFIEIRTDDLDEKGVARRVVEYIDAHIKQVR